MNILYIAPLIPSSSGSGGKRAIYNHLINLIREENVIDAIFVDVEDSGEKLPVELISLRSFIFARALPKIEFSLGILNSIFHMIFDKIPRSMAAISSTESINATRELISINKYDYLLIDHLNAFGIIRKLSIKIPVFYILHNIESEVLSDNIKQLPLFSPMRFALLFDRLKMLTIERELLSKVNSIISISSNDLKSKLMKDFLYKAKTWPELSEPKTNAWTYGGNKKLLFVGSAKYFPNRDAIIWLTQKLMPALFIIDPTIELSIVGTSESDLDTSNIPDNIIFEGFVPESRLEQLHLESDLFISPIILGGGIKVKVLEAISYGTPVLATSESLAGIDFLERSFNIFSRDSSECYLQIYNALTNASKLRHLSEMGLLNLSRAIKERPSLGTILREAL